MTLSEFQIDAAANWWTEAIHQPQFKTLADAEKDDGAKIAQMMATISAPKKSAMQLERFRIALADALRRDQPSYVSVDYNPDLILAEAASEAGFEPSMLAFPWKTSMWLSNGEVRVRHGYGAEVVTIYAPPMRDEEIA